MTLDDVISFVSRNQGRNLSTWGENRAFTAELGSSKGLIFVTEKGERHPEKSVDLEKGLSFFNSAPPNDINTSKYKQATGSWVASYVLGLFRLVKEDLEYQAGTESTLAEDVNAILSREHVDSTSGTTKEALVAARLGQGKFRSSVLEKWDNRCAVTGSSTIEAIRASHIKPWRDSTDQERLDPANGLPLVASLDALFDAGLISFDDWGSMLVSSKLSPNEQAIFGIVRKSLRKRPSPETVNYLKHHLRRHRYAGH